MGLYDQFIWNGYGVRETILCLDSSTSENELAMIQLSIISELLFGNLSSINTTRVGKIINE
jgi:hypothetical protein